MTAWICALLSALAVIAWKRPSLRRSFRFRRRHISGGNRAGPSHRTGTLRLSRAEEQPLVAGALAACLRSGLPLSQALAELDRSVEGSLGLSSTAKALAWGADPADAWGYAPQAQHLARSVRIAEDTGAHVAVLLEQAAARQRHAVAARAEAEAERLGVRVVVPLGLCALPAFICLGIIPLALALQPWAR